MAETVSATRTLSKQQQARRARLLLAARALASEGGYGAVIMHDVADRAGVARATVYRYFASKDRLLVEVAAEWAAEVTVPPPEADTAAERSALLLDRVVTAAAADLTLASAIIQAISGSDQTADRAALFVLIREALVAAIGEERPDVEMVLGHLLLSALFGLTALRTPPDEVRHMVRTAARLVL